MKLKMDDAGNPVLRDGNPVFVGEDGTETVFVPETQVAEANQSAEQWSRNLQKKLEEYETRFKNIDPDKYHEYEEKFRQMDEKKLRSEQEFDKLLERKIAEMKQSYEQELEAREQRIAALDRSHRNLLIDREILGAASSAGAHNPDNILSILRGRMDLVEQDGKFQAVAKDDRGEVLYNREGKPAGAGDLVAKLVETDGHLFKPRDASGAGSTPASGPGGTMTLTREQLKDPAVYQQHRDAILEGRVQVTE